ncbi:MAG: TolB family protein [Gemmatimonadales bacterium]
MAGERPAWSPDGRRIAFQRDGNVHVIGIEGTGETVLGVGREPAWAPGGTRLAFAGSEGIAVMREDGSALRPYCATTSATTPTPSRTWGSASRPGRMRETASP